MRVVARIIGPFPVIEHAFHLRLQVGARENVLVPRAQAGTPIVAPFGSIEERYVHRVVPHEAETRICLKESRWAFFRSR